MKTNYVTMVALLLALAPFQGCAQQAKDISVFPIRKDGFLDLEKLKTWDPKQSGVLDGDEHLVAAVRELGQLYKVITYIYVEKTERGELKVHTMTFDVRCEQLKGLLTLREILAKNPSQRSVLLSHAMSACISLAVLRSVSHFRDPLWDTMSDKTFSGGKTKDDLVSSFKAIAKKNSEITQALRSEVIKQFVTDQPKQWDGIVPLLVKEAEMKSRERAAADCDPELLMMRRASGLDVGEKGMKALAEFDETPFDKVLKDKSKKLALRYCVAIDGLVYKTKAFFVRAVRETPKEDAAWKNIVPSDEEEAWGAIADLRDAMTFEEKDGMPSCKFLRVTPK